MSQRVVEVNELKLIENFDILYKNKIILYGAGSCGAKTHRLLTAMGMTIAHFCDCDLQKCGTYIDGTEIISPLMLRRLDENEDLAIIITTEIVAYSDQILEAIGKNGLRTGNIFTVIGLEVALMTNVNDARISNIGREIFLRENRVKKMTGKYHLERLITDMFIKCASAFADNNPVIVYQPGKVGSESISHSLTAAGIPNCHLHIMNTRNFIESVDDDAAVNYAQCRETFRNSGVVRIITLVREPVSRMLSLLFELLGRTGVGFFVSPGDSLSVGLKYIDYYQYLYYFAKPKSFIEGIKKKLSTFANFRSSISSIGDIRKGIALLRSIKRKLSRMDVWFDQFGWFDSEIKEVFGVDVYAHPFDREKGYSIIKQGNVEVLIMKLEKLGALENVIGEFVGAPDFKLLRANEGSSKPYKYLYKNVQREVKLQREYFNLFYVDNPQMDHFYSCDEKAAFWKKWENNIV